MGTRKVIVLTGVVLVISAVAGFFVGRHQSSAGSSQHVGLTAKVVRAADSPIRVADGSLTLSADDSGTFKRDEGGQPTRYKVEGPSGSYAVSVECIYCKGSPADNRHPLNYDDWKLKFHSLDDNEVIVISQDPQNSSRLNIRLRNEPDAPPTDTKIEFKNLHLKLARLLYGPGEDDKMKFVCKPKNQDDTCQIVIHYLKGP